MSKFTGKFDLVDHIFGLGVYGTNQEMTYCEKFDSWKKKTGGKLYKRIKVELTKHNIDYFLNKDQSLEKTNTGYKYFGQEFKTLNKLNKYGYWTDYSININNILDLVPYLTYIPTILASSPDSEYLCISEYNYWDSQNFDGLKYGLEPRDYAYEKEEFNKFIRELVEESSNRKEGI